MFNFGSLIVNFLHQEDFSFKAVLNIGILIKMKKIFKRSHKIRTESESTDLELQSLDNIHQNRSRKKEKDRQLKLNRILLMLGLFYFLTTTVETSAFFIGTVYRDVWMEFQGRYTYSAYNFPLDLGFVTLLSEHNLKITKKVSFYNIASEASYLYF